MLPFNLIESKIGCIGKKIFTGTSTIYYHIRSLPKLFADEKNEYYISFYTIDANIIGYICDFIVIDKEEKCAKFYVLVKDKG